MKETVSSETRECVGLFGQGLDGYHAGDWQGAITAFQRNLPLEPNQPSRTPSVKSTPSLVYLEITRSFSITPPPPDWGDMMKEKQGGPTTTAAEKD